VVINGTCQLPRRRHAPSRNGPLRDWLEERHVSYVLAVPKSFPVATAAGLVRADHLAALVPAAGWQGDNKWAIELLGYVVRSQPEHAEAFRLAAEAHRREGLTKANATWRKLVGLSAALELDGNIPVAVPDSAVDILKAMSVQSIVAALPVWLRAELTWYVEMTLAVTVGGRDGGQFTLNLRRGGARGPRRASRRR
jgi:alkyl sulfatase BDS1-like metallo-beta-lactamase superfamily hydrolase